MNQGSNWKAWLGLTSVFLFGMICGGLLVVGVIRHGSKEGRFAAFLYGLGAQAQPPIPAGNPVREPGEPRRMANALLGRMTKRLNLTDEQRKKIEPYLQESGRQLREIQTETRDRARAIIEATHEKIQAELTPEQQTEFAKMREEQSKRAPFLNNRGPR